MKILDSKVTKLQVVSTNAVGTHEVETVHVTKGVLTLGKTAFGSNSQAKIGCSDTVQVILGISFCKTVSTDRDPPPLDDTSDYHNTISITVVKSPTEDSILPEHVAHVDICGGIVSEYHNPSYKISGLFKLARHVVRRTNVKISSLVRDEFFNRRQGSCQVFAPQSHRTSQFDVCYDLSMHTFDSLKAFNYKTFRSIQSMSGRRQDINDETALVALMNNNTSCAVIDLPICDQRTGSYISTQTLTKHFISKRDDQRFARLMQAPVDNSTMIRLAVKDNNNELHEVRGLKLTDLDCHPYVSTSYSSATELHIRPMRGQTRAILWQTPYKSVYFMQPFEMQACNVQFDSATDSRIYTLGETIGCIIQAAATGCHLMQQTQFMESHPCLNAFTPVQVLLSLAMNAKFDLDTH